MNYYELLFVSIRLLLLLLASARAHILETEDAVVTIGNLKIKIPIFSRQVCKLRSRSLELKKNPISISYLKNCIARFNNFFH